LLIKSFAFVIEIISIKDIQKGIEAGDKRERGFEGLSESKAG
jgi:hypothetical protein